MTGHYRWETYTAASVYLTDIIFIPFIVYYAYIAIQWTCVYPYAQRENGLSLVAVYKESFIREVVYVW